MQESQIASKRSTPSPIRKRTTMISRQETTEVSPIRRVKTKRNPSNLMKLSFFVRVVNKVLERKSYQNELQEYYSEAISNFHHLNWKFAGSSLQKSAHLSEQLKRCIVRKLHSPLHERQHRVSEQMLLSAPDQRLKELAQMRLSSQDQSFYKTLHGNIFSQYQQTQNQKLSKSVPRYAKNTENVQRRQQQPLQFLPQSEALEQTADKHVYRAERSYQRLREQALAIDQDRKFILRADITKMRSGEWFFKSHYPPQQNKRLVWREHGAQRLLERVWVYHDTIREDRHRRTLSSELQRVAQKLAQMRICTNEELRARQIMPSWISKSQDSGILLQSALQTHSKLPENTVVLRSSEHMPPVTPANNGLLAKSLTPLGSASRKNPDLIVGKAASDAEKRLLTQQDDQKKTFNMLKESFGFAKANAESIQLPKSNSFFIDGEGHENYDYDDENQDNQQLLEFNKSYLDQTRADTEATPSAVKVKNIINQCNAFVRKSDSVNDGKRNQLPPFLKSVVKDVNARVQQQRNQQQSEKHKKM